MAYAAIIFFILSIASFGLLGAFENVTLGHVALINGLCNACAIVLAFAHGEYTNQRKQNSINVVHEIPNGVDKIKVVHYNDDAILDSFEYNYDKSQITHFRNVVAFKK